MSAPVDGAVVYLLVHSLRNRTVRQVRRLREARYLLGMLFVGAYFWWLFFREGRPALLARGPETASIMAAVGAVGLLLLLAYWWVWGVNRTALAFSPAEAHFFFPGPMSRRDLIRLKILGLQPTLLLGAPLWALVLGGGGWLQILQQAVGIWLLLALVMMHRMAAALARVASEQSEHPLERRRVLPTVFWAAVLVLLAWGVAVAWSAPSAGAHPRAYASAALAALSGPVPTVLLWPFRAVLLPVLVSVPAVWVRYFAVTAAFLLLHYLWVTRTTVAFEERSLAASAERSRRVEAVRAGKPLGIRPRAAMFRVPLSPTGHPAVAIAWKNLIAATAHLRLATIGFYVGLALLVGVVLPRLMGEDAGVVVAMIALYGVGMVMLMAPVMTRNDLRGDLPRTEMRTYPLSGRALVAAEMGAVTALFAIIELGLLLLAYLAVLGTEPLGLSLSDRSAILIAAVPVVVAISALGVAIQNGLALLFPAWTRFGPAAQGFEATGQRMLNTVFFALLLTLGLVVPLIAGTLVGALVFGWLGFWALPPAALAAAAVVAAEVWLLIRWFGGLWERTDPAAVGGL